MGKTAAVVRVPVPRGPLPAKVDEIAAGNLLRLLSAAAALAAATMPDRAQGLAVGSVRAVGLRWGEQRSRNPDVRQPVSRRVVAQIICQHVLNIVRLCRTENIEDRIIRRGAVLSVFVRQGTNMRACPGL